MLESKVVLGWTKTFSAKENPQNCLTDHAAERYCKKQLTRSHSAVHRQGTVEAGQWSNYEKTQILLSTCQKLSCGSSLVSFFIRPFFVKTTHEARVSPSLCPLNWFKLVCILANPNNSHMLLNSKLMRIRFWKRKKQLNIDNCFLHTSMRLFLSTNQIIQSHSEKTHFNTGNLMWAKALCFHSKGFRK